jgi:hypothetical protein
MGIPAGPGSYVRDFAAMYRFEDGRIAERWALREDLGMIKAARRVRHRAGLTDRRIVGADGT